MPTDKQRRETARRHLERQLQARQIREAKRRKFNLLVSIIGSVVVVVLVVGFIIAVGHDDKKGASAGASGSPSASAPPATPSPSTTVINESKTSGACGYTQAPSANKALKNVGLPPDPSKTPTTTRTMTLKTNKGTIKIQLDGALAPCNVQSIAYLAAKKFFNKTSCFRLVTTGIFVLQCGDPKNNGQGGPSYTVNDENLTKAAYTSGVVAMANSGPNTNGSQFFIMTKDSSAGLAKSYTEIGKVTEGMDIISAVAAGGSDNGNGDGDGTPKVKLTFDSVTVSPPVTGSGKPVPVQVTETVTPSPAAS